MNQNLEIINEMYSKCLKQSQDITNGIIYIRKGIHSVNVVDKVRDKILEKLENYEETLRMMERMINECKENDKYLWKKKTENMRVSLSDLTRDLEKAVMTLKQKFKGENLFFKV